MPYRAISNGSEQPVQKQQYKYAIPFHFSNQLFIDAVHGNCLFYRAINDPINIRNVTNYQKINQYLTPVCTNEGVKWSWVQASGVHTLF